MKLFIYALLIMFQFLYIIGSFTFIVFYVNHYTDVIFLTSVFIIIYFWIEELITLYENTIV